MVKESLEIIIKGLVEHIEEVNITEKNDENGIIMQVKVAESDMGRIIGKQGRVAKAIRTVIKSIAGKEKKKVNIEFIG